MKLGIKVIAACLIFYLKTAIIFAFNEPGLCDVNIYKDVLSSSLPVKHPSQPLVNQVSNSICLIKINYPNSLPEYETGVLIHPQLVVTDMHGFARYFQASDHSSQPYGDPLADYNNVKVYFGWKSGVEPASTDPGWKAVSGWDPPPSFTYLNNGLNTDFIVLKLQDAQPSANVAAVDRLSTSSIPPIPFFIHHAGLYPMMVSYDPDHAPSISFGSVTYNPLFPSFKGWGIASGGGLFWGDNTWADANCGKLLGLVNIVSSLDWDGQSEKPKIQRGPRISCVFDKTYGAKNFVPNIMHLPLSYNITGDDLNTYWELSQGVPASGSVLYKYTTQHSVKPYYWFGYGASYSPIIKSFALSTSLLGDAPKGNYEIFIEMMKSTSCTNRLTDNVTNSFTEYTGGSCPDLTTSGGKIEVFSDVTDGETVTNATPLTQSSLTDFYFYQNTRQTYNTDNHYSDVIKFDVGNVYYDPNSFANRTIFIKVKALLRWVNDLNSDITQGLSIHSIKAIYKGDPNSGTTYTPNSAHQEFINCRTVTYDVTLGPNNGYYPMNPQPQIWIDWNDGVDGNTDYQVATGTIGTNASGNQTYTIHASHLYKNNGTFTVGCFYNNINNVQIGYPGASKTFDISCPNLAAPAAPSDLTVTPFSATSVILNWKNNASSEDGFRIVCRQGGGYNDYYISPNVSNFIVNYLYVNGDHCVYSFYIYAYNKVISNGSEVTSYSNSSNIANIGWGVPPIPTNFTANSMNNGVLLNWTDNADNETGFVISWHKNGSSITYTQTISANQTSMKIYGLLSNTTYIFDIKAINLFYSSNLATTNLTTGTIGNVIPDNNLTVSNLGKAMDAAATLSSDGSQLTLSGNSTLSNTSENVVLANSQKSGNFQVDTRLDATSDRAGIMIRQSLDTCAPVVYLCYQSPWVAVNYRSPQNVSKTWLPSGALPNMSLPGYLRLIRYGTTIRALISSDGNSYSEIAKVQFPLGSVFVGLSTDGGNPVSSATFTNYKIRNYDPMTPIFNLLLGD